MLAAGDWDGLSKWDVPSLAVMLSTDLSNFAMVPDRSHQGMLNALLLMRLIISPAFVNDPHLVFGGISAIDPSRRYYYGNSQVCLMQGVHNFHNVIYVYIGKNVTCNVNILFSLWIIIEVAGPSLSLH